MKNQLVIAFVIILLIGFGVQSFLLLKLNDNVDRLSKQYPLTESPEITNQNVPKFFPPSNKGLFSDNRSPYEEMEKMRKNLEKMFEDSFSRFNLKRPAGGFTKTPDVDLRETANDYIVTVNLPGIDESTLKVNVEDHTLNIRVKTEKTTEESNVDNFQKKERFVGEFNRVMTLPGDVDAAKMKTIYKNGVLTITLPKK